MNYQSRYQTQIGWLFIFVLTLLIAGCGGGGSSSGGQPSGELSVQADTGDIIGIRVGETANLDGSASSTTSGSLTYKWSFTHKPQASKTAVLINENSVNPTFVPDVIGTYMVQLVVTAGGISSQRAIALVEASTSGNVTGDVRVHTSFPSQCLNCHDGRFSDANVNPGIILPKSGNHISTTNMCQACHTTFGFKLIRYVDHKEVFGNCSSCHDGVVAIGKSQFHVKTTAECSDCHNTTSFLELDVNGNYDHTGITSGCVNCHNGKTAIGINHNPDTFDKSNNDCVFCHSTTTFTGAFPDHSVILDNVAAGTDRCDNCHGSTAIGPKVGHPDITPVDCGSCHSVKQFSLGGVYNHRVDASILPCESCHNDNNSINARGKAAATNPTHLGTTEDCGTCHGVGGGDFAFGILDHNGPTTAGKRCDSCHDDSTAVGKSANHIETQITPTVVDCNVCHTPGNFATGTFDHLSANTGTLVCSDCHNNTNSVGKNATHIPTALECDSCHTADTPTTPSTFTGTLFHPTNNPTSCNSCHDGVIQKGKNSTHLTTTRDCSSCHTTVTPLTFKGGTYDHGDPGVSTNCASCHNGKIAIDKSAKVAHIPAKNECSECHDDSTVPGGFVNSIFKTNVHPGILNGCEGCHTAKYLSVSQSGQSLIKAASHVPTSQDCHSCHPNINFADKTKFTHKGITGNCESCHDGNYYVSAGAKGKTNPPPTNTHPVTTTDCGACHGIGNGFLDGGFDHSGTVDNCSSCHGDNAPAPPTGAVTRKSSFPGHVVTTQDCSICHIPGTFKTAVFNHDQIVKDCVSCHEDPGATATVKPNPGHVVTSKDCYECHNKNKFAGAQYDHTGIVSNCASCHDGVIALGKDGTHVPTGDDCSVCHVTTGMKPATFDHAGIINNCVSCHDGTLATGKTTDHVTTTLDCGSCHTVPSKVIVANGPTNGFIPASFDHSGVSNNTRCDSCHGVSSKPKSNDHWVTSFDCRDCHSTITFLGGTWKHDGNATNNCDSCHNNTSPAPNGGAKAKPNTGHINTNLQCDSCHTTARWSPTNFVHDPKGNYPGDHRQATNCVDCHGNTVTTPFVYRSPPPLAPFCAGCHENDFEPKGDHIGGKGGTVLQNRNCGNSGCHKTGDSAFD